MTKKTKKQSYPSVALALVAVIAPVLAAGVLTTHANTPLATQQEHRAIFMDRSLFDLQKMRLETRLRNADSILSNEPTHLAAPKEEINPCDVPAAVIDDEAVLDEQDILLFEDLDGSQRDTLRMQLRNHACPQDADDDYKALCERMLKARSPLETRTGLSNPEQP